MSSSSSSSGRKRKNNGQGWSDGVVGDDDEKKKIKYNKNNDKDDENINNNGPLRSLTDDGRKKKNIRQRRKERCEKLIQDAHSYGPYLWKVRDLQNALKWFVIPQSNNSNSNSINGRHSTTQHKSNSCDAKEKSSMVEVLWKQRMQYLHALLCSRGILLQRPLKLTKASSHCNNNDKISKDDGDAATKLLDKQKPLLHSVVMALAKGNAMTLKHQTNQTKDNTTLMHRPSLQRVLSSRTITRELYSLALILSSVAYNSSVVINDDDDPRTYHTTDPTTNSQRKKMFGLYFSNPKTAVCQTYASQLFHRFYELQLLAIENQENEKMENERQQSQSKSTSSSSSLPLISPAVQLLFDKLTKLAIPNARIQETIFLLLIEFNNRRYQKDESTINKDCPVRKDVLDTIHPNFISFVLKLVRLIKSNMMKQIKNDKPIILENILGIFILPSPLLCTISQLHPTTIAKVYVKQLIYACIHIKGLLVKSISSIVVQHYSTKNTGSNDSSSRYFDWYQDIMIRLVNLCQTHHSLRDLVKELFHTYPQWSQPTKNIDAHEDIDDVDIHLYKHYDYNFLLSIRDDLLSFLNKS